MKNKFELCIQDFQECYRICSETKKYCLDKGGVFTNAELIQTLGECITICNMGAHLVVTKTSLHNKVWEAGIKACKKCAAVCNNFTNDLQMLRCAAACTKCAESCGGMLNLRK